jgi:hypothetical protein
LKFWKVVYPPTTHPNVGDFGCVPVRTSLPSEPPGTLPRRRTLNVESSLLGRSTEWPEPESAYEWPEPESVYDWEPNDSRMASPGSGWETPSSFATAWKLEIVC